jgi:tungstate transport system permease protein
MWGAAVVMPAAPCFFLIRLIPKTNSGAPPCNSTCNSRRQSNCDIDARAIRVQLQLAIFAWWGELGDFPGIVGLSIGVSLAATVIAAAFGLPFGAALAVFPFRGRRFLIVLANAFFGLPPVVVGLVLYLALSRSGPFGFLELLYTPAAMVIAQAILAAPIITALVQRASERAWTRYGDELICDGATRARAIPEILRIIRADLLTALLAGFGRTISEVGAVILVGGNIRGLTRTMTTTIALQTGQGELALALALGAVLIGISISISATVFALAGAARTSRE